MELNTVVCMDAAGYLAGLESESVHLAVLDPPYGIQYESGHRTDHTGKPRRTRASFGADEFDASWLPAVYRVLRADGAVYLFTQWRVMGLWLEAMESAGFVVHACLIWDKMHWGQGNLNYYGTQTEMVLFATKAGTHRLQWDKREGNLWRLGKLDAINHEGNYDNPAQKPERLIGRILTRSSRPGDVVLDTFVGNVTN